MRILLTGGSGDLGTLLTMDLIAAHHAVTVIDMQPPKIAGPAELLQFVHASIMDRNTLARTMQGMDIVVHIAAWHGIHEVNGSKTPAEFHDLNVTGTFNTLEAAAQAGVKKFVFISSTSIEDKYGVYGHTKVLNEEMCRAYAHRHGMNIVILRPRAFIPGWNRAVYKNFIEWAAWFMKGAVHIDDVKQATLLAIDLLGKGMQLHGLAPAVDLDGAYEYTAADMANWDIDGPGSTFARHYAGFVPLAEKHGLDIGRRPKILGTTAARALLNYEPRYSLKSLLQELETFGTAGPPPPYPEKAA
ncbi:MAG: NAD(P)-dependent oxidoreductase [Micavibrio sp.]|nr:NAD(P)-dependent oxidoreductase [Micavibrio sp.]